MCKPISKEDILPKWERRVLKAIDAHYESARHFAAWNVKLGVPSVILSIIVCGLAFSTVAGPTPLRVQVTIGILAIIQTVLASLHTWRRDSETSDKHRLAAAQYASIRRQIEQVRNSELPASEQVLSDIRTQLDTLGTGSPSIPPPIWKRTQIAYSGNGTAGGKILLNGIEVKRNYWCLYLVIGCAGWFLAAWSWFPSLFQWLAVFFGSKV